MQRAGILPIGDAGVACDLLLGALEVRHLRAFLLGVAYTKAEEGVYVRGLVGELLGSGMPINEPTNAHGQGYTDLNFMIPEHVGEFLANAPFATGSFAAYVKHLGPWSGGLEYRYLGAFPLSSDDIVQGSGYGEWNGDVRYAFANGWAGGLGLYNILNVRANAAEFRYIDRLPGEPAAGVADLHVHPLEPRSVRITLSKGF